MQVLLIGGTGLLGSEGAKAMIARGDKVKALALPPVPQGAVLPPEIDIVFGNYMHMPDKELAGHLKGCEGLVFAAGVDERLEGPPPIYNMFEKYNITPLRRLLRIAKEQGVKHTVICGSYFSHFAKQWPDMELGRRHPYIQSRLDQEEMAFSFADTDFHVAILQIPYVFGAQPGRKPVWMFLVDIIRAMPFATFYPAGGSAMVTTRQVGHAMAEALHRSRSAKAWPLGCVNMTWQEMLGIFHKYMGYPKRRVVTISKGLFTLGAKARKARLKRRGLETGLDYDVLGELMTRNAYIDPAAGCEPLGLPREDMEKAIGESVTLCMDILKHQKSAVEMKGE